MGISTEVWRVRIGTFHHRPFATGGGHGDVKISGNGMCAALRLVLLSMLLCSGDVESNPGPHSSSQQHTERRKTRQTTLLGTYAASEQDQCELSDIMRELRNVKSDLGRKMDKLSSDLHKKIDDLSHDICDVKREVEEAREETARLVNWQMNLTV